MPIGGIEVYFSVWDYGSEHAFITTTVIKSFALSKNLSQQLDIILSSFMHIQKQEGLDKIYVDRARAAHSSLLYTPISCKNEITR